jgi:hypothetical protein
VQAIGKHGRDSRKGLGEMWRRKQGEDVGTDGVERHISQVEQAGEADSDKHIGT